MEAVLNTRKCLMLCDWNLSLTPSGSSRYQVVTQRPSRCQIRASGREEEDDDVRRGGRRERGSRLSGGGVPSPYEGEDLERREKE